MVLLGSIRERIKLLCFSHTIEAALYQMDLQQEIKLGFDLGNCFILTLIDGIIYIYMYIYVRQIKQ